MEFFVPEAEDKEQAEEVWEETKKFVEQQRGPVKDLRIYGLTYTDHDTGKTHTVHIGDRVPRVGEQALVILESDSESIDVFYVCTAHRAVIEGIPVMIGKRTVSSVEEFD